MCQKDFAIEDRERENQEEKKVRDSGRVKTAVFKPAKGQRLDLLSVRVCVCETSGGQRSGGPGD